MTNSPDKFFVEKGIITEGSIIEAKAQLAENYYKIIEVFDEWIDIPEKYKKFIAVWIIGTYFHKEFSSYPYLFFNAMRGSGKTRMLKLISSLSAKSDGSVQNNMTEAVLFRTSQGTTTCIDEIEQISSKEKQTLRELLNSAYKKGTKVKRMRKVKLQGQETQVIEVFEPFFPICMANIRGVEEVLADRSVVIILEKSDHEGITKKIEDFEVNDKIKSIRFALTKIGDVVTFHCGKKTYTTAWNEYINSKYISSLSSSSSSTSYNVITSQDIDKDIELEQLFNKIDDLGITGRNFELLYPLLLTANLVGKEVFDEIINIGSSLIQQKKEDEYVESKDVTLYEFVVSMESFGLEQILIKELTARFREWMGEQDQDDKWLNEKWVGQALKRLNLVLCKKKTHKGSNVILNYSKAREKLRMFKEVPKEEVKNETI